MSVSRWAALMAVGGAVIGSQACSSSEDSPTTSTRSSVAAGWPADHPGYHGSEPLPLGVAYLTFDDGPGEFTEQFLDILKSKNVRATFFINGRNLKANGLTSYSKTLARILSDGHALGNHTFNHENLPTLSSDEVAATLDTNKAKINEALAQENVPPVALDLIRSPFGAQNSDVEDVYVTRGFSALWNVESGDSSGWAPGEWFCDYVKDLADIGNANDRQLIDHDCVDYGGGVSAGHLYDPSLYQDKVGSLTDSVLGSSAVTNGQGFVSLMHDTHPTSRDALPGIIDGLKAANYKFETLQELKQRSYGSASIGIDGGTPDAAPVHEAGGQIAGGCTHFDETNQDICSPFLEFWKNNGALSVFGFPRSSVEAVTSAQDGGAPPGVTGQWFERSRLEAHPEASPPNDVQVAQLGVLRLSEALKGIQIDIDQKGDVLRAAMAPEHQGPPPAPGCEYFTKTQHWVCNEGGNVGFLAFWKSIGIRGLVEPANHVALFGNPITSRYDAMTSDGKPIRVQWFERARFEWHPENADPYRVLLGRLGK